MKLLLVGHQMSYQLQSLLAAFFPFRKFETVFAEDLPEEPVEGLSAVVNTSAPTPTAKVIWREGNHTKEASATLNRGNKEEINMTLAKLAYPLLCDQVGFSLPYGIYTGIRPVKNAFVWAEAGVEEAEIRRRFEEEFLVSKEKIDLVLQTLDCQREILKQTKEKSYSLFVFIPFCPSRCRYCSFVSKAIGTNPEKEIRPYLDVLKEELAATAMAAKEASLELDTVYIGGGTPSVLSAKELKELLETIAIHFPLTNETEFTLEAGRPDTITEEKLLVMKAFGVNRISINPQTFCHQTLKAIGRSHTPLEVLEAFSLARKCGFNNINMDFIAALPGEETKDLLASLQTAVSLQPENITLHTLTVKRSADYRAEADFDPEGDKKRRQNALEMTAAGEAFLNEAGYAPYYLYRQKNTIGCLENTGWTKKGKACAYNIRIMEENQNILACGANASTKLLLEGDRIVRIFNAKFPYDYCNDKERVLARKADIPKLLQGEIDTTHLPGVPDKGDKTGGKNHA